MYNNKTEKNWKIALLIACFDRVSFHVDPSPFIIFGIPDATKYSRRIHLS